MKLIFLSYLMPLFGAILLAFPFQLSEKFITKLTTTIISVTSLVSFYLIGWFIFSGPFPQEIELATFSVSGHEFPLIAWIDHNTLAFLGLTQILALLVIKFSHGYLHLEKGYQRFFSTILFFVFGMEVLSFAGTIDLFFAGWEIVGFSSYLLIAFYRSHSRSVSNALRIYNLYRICDIGLLIGAVIGHVLWQEATRFSDLSSITVQSLAAVNEVSLAMLTVSIIIASLGKSAQFPFHNWPSRAMEGPTPSSAIFYGALSIHAGVFLLLRTQSLWSHQLVACIAIGFIGLLTLFFSSIQGGIQTNIKGQIAFASTSQIGIMFIELSLGFSKIVLLHLVCHALYRCFQLLVSPSIVASSTSLNNKVIFQRKKSHTSIINKLPLKLRNTLYVLGMTDFSMDISWRGFGFLGWKSIYRLSRFGLNHPAIPTFLLASICTSIVLTQTFWTSLFLLFLSLFFSLKTIFCHFSPFAAMRDLALSILGCMLAMYNLDAHFLSSIQAYMIPLTPFLITALIICWKFRNYDLKVYSGLGTTYSFHANLFMLCFMVLSGMPITTAFVGEDMLLEELILHSHFLTAIVTICFMVSGLLCAKIYSRLFMGLPPSIKAPTIQ